MKNKIYKIISTALLYISLLAVSSGINFSGNRSPGWFIQPLPINDSYNDLFFIDTLHGWMVSTGYPGTTDTGYIIHTYDGGYNWVVQKAEPQLFLRVQFLDTNYGYVVGGYPLPCIEKTTNGGNNWTDISSNIGDLFIINDLSFVNKDTGWVCINDFFDGGVYKTMNGGFSWTLQKFDQRAYKLCFISKDTGWYCTDESKLYRTTNGGNNWVLQYTNLSGGIGYLFFLNGSKGWIRAGSHLISIMLTTDGGFNWVNAQGNVTAGHSTKFVNENLGYSCSVLPKMAKSTDGGFTWGYQTTPIWTSTLLSAIINDTNNIWAGQLMHTTDGGGPIIYTGIKPHGNFIPSFVLKQNYPNPFNPSTKISFEILKSSYIDLDVFDITGREITSLINNRLYNNAGIYEINFESQSYNLSSGVYIYRLTADTENHKEIFIDSKKMLYVK